MATRDKRVAITFSGPLMTEASETSILPVELSDEFDIVFDDKLRTITMKFALLRELARLLPGPNDPQLVFHDQNMFEDVLVTLLIPRDERGKPNLPKAADGTEQDWSLDDHDFDAKEAVALVKWAMEHVIGFFLSKFTTMTTLGESQLDQIEILLSSLPGLKGLASKKASAGPTASNTPTLDDITGASPIEI